MPVSQPGPTPPDSSATSTDICAESRAEIRSGSTPLAQSPNPSNQSRGLRLRIPGMTFVLASLVVVIYCLQVLADHSTPKHPYDPVLLALGMKGDAVFAGQWWRLLTAIFVHIDLYHLLSNLCFLLLFGSIAESVFERAGYLALWLLAGIAGSLSQLLALSLAYYGFGASGVAFGLVGALWSASSLERVGPATIVRRWAVVFLLAFFILLGFLPDWIHSGSFNAAHLGGLLAGMVLGLVIPVRQTPAPARRLCVTVVIAAVLLVACVKIARAKHEPGSLQTGRASRASPSGAPAVPQSPR